MKRDWQDRTSAEILARSSRFVEQQGGHLGVRRMREPSQALEERDALARAFDDPNVREAVHRVAQERVPDWSSSLRSVTETSWWERYDTLLRAMPTLLRVASVYLWSREMEEVSLRAAREYPFTQADCWSVNLLELEPGGLRGSYWAQEVDWGLGGEGGAGTIQPTIFSSLSFYVPKATPEIRRLLPQFTGERIVRFLIMSDPKTSLPIPVPSLDVVCGDVVRSEYEGQPTGEGEFYGCLQFLRSPYVMAQSIRPSRAVRRRAIREHLPEPEPVRVVVLRRRGKGQVAEDSEAVNWSYRWLVTGHWRQQWYQSEKAHHPIWIAPYVKGPEDRPLKMPARPVYSVIR